MTRAEIEAWVAQSRAAQGLPPQVEDPAVLARVVQFLTSPYPRKEI